VSEDKVEVAIAALLSEVYRHTDELLGSPDLPKALDRVHEVAPARTDALVADLDAAIADFLAVSDRWRTSGRTSSPLNGLHFRALLNTQLTAIDEAGEALLAGPPDESDALVEARGAAERARSVEAELRAELVTVEQSIEAAIAEDQPAEQIDALQRAEADLWRRLDAAAQERDDMEVAAATIEADSAKAKAETAVAAFRRSSAKAEADRKIAERSAEDCVRAEARATRSTTEARHATEKSERLRQENAGRRAERAAAREDRNRRSRGLPPRVRPLSPAPASRLEEPEQVPSLIVNRQVIGTGGRA